MKNQTREDLGFITVLGITIITFFLVHLLYNFANNELSKLSVYKQYFQ